MCVWKGGEVIIIIIFIYSYYYHRLSWCLNLVVHGFMVINNNNY